ncbi:MAG: hypothetical protein JRG69_11675 [Deltaproteobacteria bacterium]|nr:hypothetical protein [Deltaproteobacteria bacterium]
MVREELDEDSRRSPGEGWSDEKDQMVAIVKKLYPDVVVDFKSGGNFWLGFRSSPKDREERNKKAMVVLKKAGWKKVRTSGKGTFQALHIMTKYKSPYSEETTMNTVQELRSIIENVKVINVQVVGGAPQFPSTPAGNASMAASNEKQTLKSKLSPEMQLRMRDDLPGEDMLDPAIQKKEDSAAGLRAIIERKARAKRSPKWMDKDEKKGSAKKKERKHAKREISQQMRGEETEPNFELEEAKIPRGWKRVMSTFGIEYVKGPWSVSSTSGGVSGGMWTLYSGSKKKAQYRSPEDAMNAVDSYKSEDVSLADELRSIIERKGGSYERSSHAATDASYHKTGANPKASSKEKKKAASKSMRQSKKKEIAARMKGEDVTLDELGDFMEILGEESMEMDDPIRPTPPTQLRNLKTILDTSDQLGRFSTEFSSYLNRAMESEEVDIAKLGRFGRQVDSAHKIFKDTYRQLALGYNEDVGEPEKNTEGLDESTVRIGGGSNLEWNKVISALDPALAKTDGSVRHLGGNGRLVSAHDPDWRLEIEFIQDSGEFKFGLFRGFRGNDLVKAGRSNRMGGVQDAVKMSKEFSKAITKLKS